METREYVFFVLTVIFIISFGIVLFLLFLYALWLRFSRVYYCLSVFSTSDNEHDCVLYTVVSSSRHLFQPDDTLIRYSQQYAFWFPSLSEAKEQEASLLSDFES